MRTPLLVSLVVVVCTTAITSTQTNNTNPVIVDSITPALDSRGESLWFVELSSPPTVDGSSLARIELEEADFHRTASAAGIRYKKRRHFRSLWNGLAVQSTLDDASKLRSLAGVKAVYPVAVIQPLQIDEDPGYSGNLATALAMAGVDVAQRELGLTGRGVRVAVIDSGIDYHHPDLGGCFGRGCRVAKGFDLVGDAFIGFPTIPPAPDDDPDDCAGHGTHVSGIIGANGGVTGVAPNVTLHAYRVFGCQGGTTADLLLEAMERALEGGADVVNMSIGSPSGWPQEPTGQAADRLVRRGVVVVASIGNEGQFGLYFAADPGVAKQVIGVASFDNTHLNLPSFTVSPDDRPIGYSPAVGAPPAPSSGSAPLARTGTPQSTTDACTALPAESLTNSVALIRTGGCPFAIKALNAQTAGAIGVVIYNNVPGFGTISVSGASITIPVVFITAANGVLLDSRIAAGPAELTWTALQVSEPQPNGGLVSSFSSYGPAPDLSFKPDLGAPGGAVNSTLPLEQGGYGNRSGTSMSSPYVAGAVALLLEARPRTSPKDVQARLQNTAFPRPFGPSPALIDTVHRQGAGMLDITRAVEADDVVTPGSLALGEIETGSAFRILRISHDDRVDDSRRRSRRKTRDRVTYTLGHEPAMSTGTNTFSPTFIPSFATVQFVSPTVTVGRSRFDDGLVPVLITPPESSLARLFGGYITLTPDDEGPVLRVPYVGYKGDYQAIAALTPTPNNFPWLAKLVGTSIVNQPDGAVYTMQGTDVPFILFHLDHPVRVLKMEVVDAASGASFQFASQVEFFARSATATSATLFLWSGGTSARPEDPLVPVPDGTYRIELSVLKALGDKRNTDHVERWVSPEITIARPVPVTPTSP
jgi:subtilisin family serine protease